MLPRVRVSPHIFYLFRDRIGTLNICNKKLMVNYFLINYFLNFLGLGLGLG